MSQPKVNLELSKAQMEFLKAEDDYTVFCGGLGSGKTFTGALWSVIMTQKYPNTNGLITANSFKQLRRATLPELFSIFELFGIQYKYKQQDGEIKIENGSTLYLLSAENYEDARGFEVGWAWSDECAFYKERAFDVIMGRIRDKEGPCVWKGTTTPNGYNWLYDRFVQEPLPKSKVVTSKTTDNLVNLSEKYYDRLKTQYDTKLAQQELEGAFVNLNSGTVYYAFDRHRHCKATSDSNSLIFVGLDFNVHPLCGVFCVEKNKQIHIVDELYLEDSNTFEAAKQIIKRYPYQTIQVVSDDNGGNRSTSARYTDHEILRRSNLEVIKFRNPFVKDRYNNVNRLFDHDLLVIDPKCKKLIQDLEKLTYDNKDDMLSHISDALGYVTWHLAPLKKVKREARIIYK